MVMSWLSFYKSPSFFPPSRPIHKKFCFLLYFVPGSASESQQVEETSGFPGRFEIANNFGRQPQQSERPSRVAVKIEQTEKSRHHTQFQAQKGAEIFGQLQILGEVQSPGWESAPVPTDRCLPRRNGGYHEIPLQRYVNQQNSFLKRLLITSAHKKDIPITY